MRKQIINIFIFCICFIPTKVFTQVINDSIITFVDSINGYYKYNPNKNLVFQDFFNHWSSLRLSSSDGFILLNTNSDELGYKHYRYLQSFNSIPIENSMFIVHTDFSGKLLYGNGFLIKNLNLSTTLGITANNAITIAINQVNATTYFWQDSTLESSLKEETNNQDTSYYPVAQLVIAKTDLTLDNNPQNFRLCYRVPIIALEPRKSYDVYIDATTGVLIRQTPASNTCIGPEPLSCAQPCSQGTANTLYYSGQYIKTDRFWYVVNCTHRLKNTCTGTFLYVVKSNGNDYRDGTNLWTDANDKPGTTSLWCLERAHDYYRFTFGRNSYDGNYSQIKIFTHDGNFQNAAWDRNGKFLHMGVVAGKDMTSLDIQGHELTHGITQATANLGGSGSGEQGALNESFSDIFGTMIEFYAKSNYNANGYGNYLYGEDVLSPTCGLQRSLSNPKTFCQPNTYQGQNWDSQGEVHTNDAVQNFWFYLLSEGGAGHIDDKPSNPSYCVSKIGRDKAAAICYRSLTTKLSPGVNYNNARYYSILSAQELYGANSNEVAQVTQAWYAVGVGTTFSGTIEYNNLTVSATQIISHNNAIVFNNFNTTPTGNFTVTSNTKITMNQNSRASSGSYFHAYIAPACVGGALIEYSDNGDVNNSDKIYSINSIASNSKDSSQQTIKTNNNINIAPNPNNGTFQLSITKNNKVIGVKEIKVFNLLGVVIWETGSSSNNVFTIDITGYPQGIYYVHTVNEQNEIEMKKFIKL